MTASKLEHASEPEIAGSPAPPPNGATPAQPAGDASGSLIGAEGKPLSAYPGWDPKRGVFVQHDPAKRPSALLARHRKKRKTPPTNR